MIQSLDHSLIWDLRQYNHCIMTFSICVTGVVFCNCPDVLLDTSGFWKHCNMCWEDLFKEQCFVVSKVEFSHSPFPSNTYSKIKHRQKKMKNEVGG